MNNPYQSFIFPEVDDDQFDQPPPLVFSETYPNTLVRRSFPLIPNKTPRTSYSSGTMLDLQELHEEAAHYLGNQMTNMARIQYEDQLPQIGLHDNTNQLYNPQEQECGSQHVQEEEFKLICFPVNSPEDLYDENGKKKEISFPKDAVRWTREERQRKYVCINSHQYKIIMRRRKRRQQSQRYNNILNSATQTINSTTTSVVLPKKKYKYESRHAHAQNRVRDKRGKFIAKGKLAEKESPVGMYEQDEKQRKSDASLPQWDMSQHMEQMGQIEPYCPAYQTLPQMNSMHTLGTLTNNMNLNFDIARLAQMNACSPPLHQLDTQKEIPKNYTQQTEIKVDQIDNDNGSGRALGMGEMHPNGNIPLYNYGYYNSLNVGNVIDVAAMNGLNQSHGTLL